MFDITFTLTDIVGACSAIGIIWGVVKIWQDVRKPTRDLLNTIHKHEQFLNQDKLRIDEIDESNKILCKSMLVLINHEITGNGIDKMKQARDELQDYLIKR